ncbi:hypothetical protein NBRC116493_05930 [Aurantivibrio infirmus]
MLTFKRKPNIVLVLGLVAISLVFTWPSLALAQKSSDDEAAQKKTSTEQNENKESSENESSNNQASNNQQQSNTSTPPKSPEIFIPSEEISKDLSVSFPVDI